MKPALTLVRDALPLERLNCTRIRDWLAAGGAIGAWSRTAPAAIRPQRLATLIRNRIWEAHDVTLGSVRDRLARVSQADDHGSVDYWVRLEIEVEPDQEIELCSRTRFTIRPSGRICAEIALMEGNLEHPVTEGPVSLRRRDDV